MACHDISMTSEIGTVSVIKPPRLTSVLLPDLIKFETAYAQYVREVNDVNATRNNDNQLRITSIRSCIESRVLQSLCMLGEIDGAATIEDATDENVKAWFDSALAETPRTVLARLKSAISALKYEQCDEDPAGAAQQFCLSAVAALDEQNISAIINDVEKCKTFIDMLVNKVEPSFLRKQIKEERTIWSKEQQGSMKYFMQQLKSNAAEAHKWAITNQAKPIGSRSDRKRTREREGTKSNSANQSKGKKSKHSDSKDSTRNTTKKWSEPCLNPKCSEKHRIKDCPITSEEERQAFLSEYYDNKKTSKSVKALSNDPAEDSEKATPLGVQQDSDPAKVTPDPEAGRFRVLIEDKVEAVILGDSGAEFSALPDSLMQKVLKVDPEIAVNNFDKPMQLKVAFDTDKSISFTASRSTTLDITIILPGSNIPIRIRGVEFIITDQEMDEILLGRPLLHSIGFDFHQHLLKVRSEIHDKDLSKLPSLNKPPSLSYIGSLSPLGGQYSGLSYQDADDDPIELPDAISAGIGTDSEESIDNAFRNIVISAERNGISDLGKQRLIKILGNHRDVFRIKLGPDHPAKVPPLVITPAKGTTPYRSPQRRYAPIQRDFIIRTVKELEKIGAIYKNPSALWASPAFAVPKPGTNKLRFTVDLRGPNARTVPIISAMPHLESRLQDVAGSTCFANIDLAHGYWQVPLSKESQEMMSIQTPIGVYSSRRLLQGGTDSGNHFQAVLQQKLNGRVEKYLQWIDDFLFYGKNEAELLDSLEAFFTVCNEVGIKVHAEKGSFFGKQATFCGRIINAQGVQYHPRHFESLLAMNKPTTAAELQQLLCATNWMRSSIPSYAETIAPLHILMEKAYSKAGKRTKHAVRKISLANEWGANHDAAFASIKSQLAAKVKLAHPKPDHIMCLFTDASDTHWAAILTQFPSTERRQPIEDQKHEPLCFLSGAFKGSSANWSVPEKEGFAIVESMCRLDYLVVGHTVSIYTDHANLVYMYDPYGRNPGISRHTASKLMRWAIKLSAFRYVVQHLPGEENVWADMLTRWAANSKSSVSTKRLGKFMSLMLAPVNPSMDSKFDWPSLSDVFFAQKNTKEKPPNGFGPSDKGIINADSVFWLPSRSCHPWGDSKLRLLKLRILIAAHTGIGGHRGPNITRAAVKAHFSWSKMNNDIDSFVNSCLHCKCTEPAKTVPRPLGSALHAALPNKLLHFDYLYMSPGEDEYLYVLILKDDHSGYCWFVPTKEANAATTATSLINWFSTFGVVSTWVSDQGSHFKNELIRILRESYKTSHHFTLAYCPWSNGTVEVVCRELLRAVRALLSEFQLNQRCWPSVLPMAQSALNNSVLERLGNRTPQSVFTSLPASTPLAAITRLDGDVTKVYKLADIRAKQLLNAQRLHGALDAMHKDVAERSNRKRQAAVASHNRKTGVRPINFDVGDFVLKGLLQRERGRKPSLHWNGPFRVVECRSNYIFLIEDLLLGKKEEVHGRRLKFFQNKSYPNIGRDQGAPTISTR